MLSIHNILSIAKYESKTLTRSWFFRIFALLSILAITLFNVGTLTEVGQSPWLLRAIYSAIPMSSLLLLNVGQAIICVFLAADFLKRDKKLDTTEVVYARPMSNSEYVLGKTWGNIKVFIALNFIVLLITFVFNALAKEAAVDPLSYVVYFFIISIPTLIFIMGLSFLLMSLIRNQALTFVLLLGYIGLTLFYLQTKFYYLFDYMSFKMPMLKSPTVGFSQLDRILMHRGLYLVLGISFISFTISLLKRLPNSRIASHFFGVFGFFTLAIGLFMGYSYVMRVIDKDSLRNEFVALNNKYIHMPRLNVTSHDIQLEQRSDGFHAVSNIEGNVNKEGDSLVFVLNPALNVTRVTTNGTELNIKREKQLLLIKMPNHFTHNFHVDLEVEYEGGIDESICYLDIDKEEFFERNNEFIFSFDKRFSFVESNYMLLAPEAYWYPVAGVGYSTVSPNWYHKDFIDFGLTVTPLSGLIPVSHGFESKTDEKFVFNPKHQLPQLYLSIGAYEQKSMDVDSVKFTAWYFKGHDFFSNALPEISDTINDIITESFNDYQRGKNQTYSYDELQFIEVPIHFSSYGRTWKSTFENTQPGAVLLPEKCAFMNDAEFNARWKRMKKWNRGQNKTDQDFQIDALRSFMGNFKREGGDRKWKKKKGGGWSVAENRNPYNQVPQLYSFKYNVTSDEWPIFDQILEAYMTASESASRRKGWMREMNGVTENEKVNLLLQQQSFKELLATTTHKGLINPALKQKGTVLFSLIQAKVGEDEFKSFLDSTLRAHQFSNFTFESFDEALNNRFGVRLDQFMDNWFKQTELPGYMCSTPEAIKVKDDEMIKTRVHFKVTNVSDVSGVIKVTFNSNAGRGRGRGRGRVSSGAPVQKLIFLEGNQTKELYYMLEEQPRTMFVNTLVSKNLPAIIVHQFNKIERNKRAKPIERETVIENSPVAIEGKNEIIVDNEDKGFSVDGNVHEGVLQKLLVSQNKGDDDFKYKGFNSWRPPAKWTLNTNSTYFGKTIRSAYVIRSGDGTQKANWKLPVQKSGLYEVFYYIHKSESFRRRKKETGTYHFQVQHDDGNEDVIMDIKECDDGWNSLGTYYFSSGDSKVVLSNDSKMKSIIADAVKLVKQ